MTRVIALLTDFGTQDYFVGAMKGAILSISPHSTIVDITHDISPQDIGAASFTLRACYRDFPPQTIFVAVVDPGVGSARRAILVEADDYRFIAPDNGLLNFVLNGKSRVFELTNEKYFAARVSGTFHGRDVFAPVAAHLSNGVEPEEFGNRITDYITFENAKPRRVSETEIEAGVIHIDRFGNLVTNLTPEDLPAEFILRIHETTIEKHLKYYAEAKPNELFSITGSAGFLEIVAFNASAANLLRVTTGAKISVQANLHFSN